MTRRKIDLGYSDKLSTSDQIDLTIDENLIVPLKRNTLLMVDCKTRELVRHNTKQELESQLGPISRAIKLSSGNEG